MRRRNLKPILRWSVIVALLAIWAIYSAASAADTNQKPEWNTTSVEGEAVEGVHGLRVNISDTTSASSSPHLNTTSTQEITANQTLPNVSLNNTNQHLDATPDSSNRPQESYNAEKAHLTVQPLRDSTMAITETTTVNTTQLNATVVASAVQPDMSIPTVTLSTSTSESAATPAPASSSPVPSGSSDAVDTQHSETVGILTQSIPASTSQQTAAESFSEIASNRKNADIPPMAPVADGSTSGSASSTQTMPTATDDIHKKREEQASHSASSDSPIDVPTVTNTSSKPESESSPTITSTDAKPDAPDPSVPRGPDASVVQDRVNVAAYDAGAKLILASRGIKKAKDILNGDNDRYLMYECKSPQEKWVIIQLSEDMVVDTIVTANLEHYSSGVKDFRVFGSSVYPAPSWTLLGTLRAEDNNMPQAFRLFPSWARYLKVIFDSYHETEGLCTMTYLRVYGTTMFKQFEEELKRSTLEAKESTQRSIESLQARVNAHQAEVIITELPEPIPQSVQVIDIAVPPPTTNASDDLAQDPETSPSKDGSASSSANSSEVISTVATGSDQMVANHSIPPPTTNTTLSSSSVAISEQPMESSTNTSSDSHVAKVAESTSMTDTESNNSQSVTDTSHIAPPKAVPADLVTVTQGNNYIEVKPSISTVNTSQASNGQKSVPREAANPPTPNTTQLPNQISSTKPVKHGGNLPSTPPSTPPNVSETETTAAGTNGSVRTAPETETLVETPVVKITSHGESSLGSETKDSSQQASSQSAHAQSQTASKVLPSLTPLGASVRALDSVSAHVLALLTRKIHPSRDNLGEGGAMHSGTVFKILSEKIKELDIHQTETSRTLQELAVRVSEALVQIDAVLFAPSPIAAGSASTTGSNSPHSASASGSHPLALAVAHTNSTSYMFATSSLSLSVRTARLEAIVSEILPQLVQLVSDVQALSSRFEAITSEQANHQRLLESLKDEHEAFAETVLVRIETLEEKDKLLSELNSRITDLSEGEKQMTMILVLLALAFVYNTIRQAQTSTVFISMLILAPLTLGASGLVFTTCALSVCLMFVNLITRIGPFSDRKDPSNEAHSLPTSPNPIRAKRNSIKSTVPISESGAVAQVEAAAKHEVSRYFERASLAHFQTSQPESHPGDEFDVEDYTTDLAAPCLANSQSAVSDAKSITSSPQSSQSVIAAAAAAAAGAAAAAAASAAIAALEASPMRTQPVAVAGHPLMLSPTLSHHAVDVPQTPKPFSTTVDILSPPPRRLSGLGNGASGSPTQVVKHLGFSDLGSTQSGEVTQHVHSPKMFDRTHSTPNTNATSVASAVQPE